MPYREPVDSEMQDCPEYNEFMELLRASRAQKNGPWGMVKDGGADTLILQRVGWKSDEKDLEEGHKERIRAGQIFRDKLPEKVKIWLNQVVFRAHNLFGVPIVPNEIWIVANDRGSLPQKIVHQDGMFAGIVNVIMMLTPGRRTQWAKQVGSSMQIPTDWRVSELDRPTKKLKAGQMYAMRGDWPHRGPGHSYADFTDGRYIMFIGYGNQSTDGTPIDNAAFLQAHAAAAAKLD